MHQIYKNFDEKVDRNMPSTEETSTEGSDRTDETQSKEEQPICFEMSSQNDAKRNSQSRL
eukprot:TRINITY_DN409_c0_g1_i1.p2 TRINITY_DN409_c0_g1~~TRINITY_DN409_c0_g1_i1.p2  ORF type:complete len:60 (-),score=13.39 TRINITY_DN409_c0_g1_i1:196-375(-)